MPTVKSYKTLTSFLFIFFTLTCSVIAQNNLKTLQKGVYFTYADFYNNTPKLIGQIEIDSTKRVHENWKNTYNFKLFDRSTGKEIKKFWGFCDGKNAFIHHNYETFQLGIKNGMYYFTGRGIPETKKAYKTHLQKKVFPPLLLTGLTIERTGKHPLFIYWTLIQELRFMKKQDLLFTMHKDKYLLIKTISAG